MNIATLPAGRSDHRPDGISAEEWDVRVQLAACYRLIDHFGMTDLIYNHITARVPGPDHRFLINPFGPHYSEITASGLVKVDLDGSRSTTPTRASTRPDTSSMPASTAPGRTCRR